MIVRPAVRKNTFTVVLPDASFNTGLLSREQSVYLLARSITKQEGSQADIGAAAKL